MTAPAGEAQLLDLVAELYAAASDPTRWPSALARLLRTFDCAGGVLYAVDHRDHSVPLLHTHAIPEVMVREHEEHYLRIDPRTSCALAKLGRPTFDYMHICEREIDRSEYYDWYRRRGDFRYYIGAALADVGGLATFVSLQRTRRQGHVGADEIALLERVLPHLRQAVSLGTSLASLGGRAVALESALHASGMAMILLDRSGRVAFTTAAAERLLAEQDGLFVDREGRLRGARAAESAALARLIGAVLQTSAGAALAAGGDVPLPRPSGKSPLLARISPIRLEDAPLAREGIAAAVVIRDPEARPRMPARSLRDLFGLTRAEAALAAAMARGTRLPAYAEAAGITHETARWHLKRVLAKTETRSQSELAARLARLLA